MILLLPGYALFLLIAAPRGWRSMFTPRDRRAGRRVRRGRRAAVRVEPADALAAARPAARPRRRAAAVLVRRHQVRLARHDGDERAAVAARAITLAMYWFDLDQQFGIAGPVLAAAGLAAAGAHATRGARCCWSRCSRSTSLFAFSYNVGDAHVFYLPSHLIARAAGGAGAGAGGRGAARAARRSPARAARAVCRRRARITTSRRSTAAATRGPTAVVDALTAGLDDRRDDPARPTSTGRSATACRTSSR